MSAVLHVVASNQGDFLTLQGAGNPVLFLSAALVSDLLLGNQPDEAIAVSIGGIGALAIITCIEGGAPFDAIAVAPDHDTRPLVTLRFTLAHGFVVGFTTDPGLAGSRSDQWRLGIHVLVTHWVSDPREQSQLESDWLRRAIEEPETVNVYQQFGPELPPIIQIALAANAPESNGAGER